jgi:hypothetical protein
MITNKLLLAAAVILVASPAAAHSVVQTHAVSTTKPYAPYEFLVGDWYTKLPQENAIIHQQFGWGPGKASMTYSTFIDMAGQPEHLHFGGVMVWNGKSHALDYLFAVEPDSGVQEKGTITGQPDGSIVRQVEATYPDGRVTQNRQTFRKLADGTVATDLLDRKPSGWVSSMPGGQPIIMSRTRPQ